MQSYLLLVHVGPVQDFIATARRCRDLWYGSHLLSEASRTVATALGETADATLIFPGRLDLDAGGTVSVANKIQCRLDGLDAEGVRSVAERARTALDDWMDGLSSGIFERVQRELGAEHQSLFLRERAEQHLVDLFEFYWIAVPIADESAYPAARKAGDRLLAARKNTRDWESAREKVQGVPKSSLDGIRESVIHEDAFGTHARLPAARRRSTFGVRSEERLCGVGLLKRLGLPRDEDAGEGAAPVFHSSSHMASAGVRTAIARSDEARVAWEHFVLELGEHLPGYPDMRIRARSGPSQTLTWTHVPHDGPSGEPVEVPFVLPLPGGDPERGLDGVLLYRERLEALWADFADEGRHRSSRLPRSLEQRQRDVLKAAGIGDPVPYYVMLLADGDRMGAAIDALAEHAGAQAQDRHRALSEALDAEFASRCDGIVRQHGGSLLYAGGDDVLALLPLGTALDCARALRDRFATAMDGLFPDEVSTPTLSVGLAIVHHLEPLSRVRAYAKQAEKAAKLEGRNNLSVLLKKRGGSPRLVTGTWDPPDSTQPLDARLAEWAGMLREGKLPSRLAGRLEEAMAPLRVTLPNDSDSDPKAFEEVVRSLVRLTASRRNERGGGKPVTALAKRVERLFDSVLAQLGRSDATTTATPLDAVDRMVDELRIAELVRDAWNEAFGRPEPSDDHDEPSQEASA
ncbi:MAG: type III-B CRISPR-associated protein Cas10/Cmr2 [Deltaproteobacteria bacterium]|nr:MAG: type III-B CRISPR-associated protein Cas10/Cmr2 [Deltaproteobacteria bacterium]